MSNFRDICRGLEQAKAAIKAKDASELAAQLARLAQDAAERDEMGRNGAAWHQGNRGATERTLALLRDDQSAR
jgi:3-deoxy-D-manno-octulosonic-acid transferase